MGCRPTQAHPTTFLVWNWLYQYARVDLFILRKFGILLFDALVNRFSKFFGVLPTM